MTSWSSEQVNVGKQIIQAVKDAGLNTNAQVIAIMTGITESGLRNIDYGDIQNGSMTTSRGPFQQIAAWGPLSVRENVYQSAMMFLKGGQAGQRGLTDINWQSMTPWAAAQAVQESEFSDGSNYQANYQAAVDFVRQYGSGTVTPVTGTNANTPVGGTPSTTDSGGSTTNPNPPTWFESLFPLARAVSDATGGKESVGSVVMGAVGRVLMGMVGIIAAIVAIIVIMKAS